MDEIATKSAPSNTEALARAKRLFGSRDKKIQALVARANDLFREKTLSGVHQDQTLTNLSVKYRNEDLIGTQLMPVVSVGKLSARYMTYSKRDRLAGPDDQVSGRSEANEIAETRSFDTYSCKSYALRQYLEATDLLNQDAPLNEMADLIAAINDQLELKEEMRIASILTTTGNFAGNTNTLAGTAQWSDFTTGVSDPMKDIQAALAGIWSGFGATRLVGYCSLDVYNTLRRHPKVLDVLKYVQPGYPMRQALANLFDLDDILVGKAWKDTANIGAAASYSKVWGKFFGVLRVANNPTTQSAAFGHTFRMGQKVTSEWFDPKLGVDGGYWGKVGFHEDHKIVAADTGWLIAGAIA